MRRKPPGNVRLVLGHLLVIASIAWACLLGFAGHQAIGDWAESDPVGDQGAIGIILVHGSAWTLIGGPLLGLALVCYVSSIASSSYFAAAEAWKHRASR